MEEDVLRNAGLDANGDFLEEEEEEEVVSAPIPTEEMMMELNEELGVYFFFVCQFFSICF